MRREAPAAARNRQPILDVLRPHLPPTGLVVEVASGTGEHTAHFAQALPDLIFQPSDPAADARASIDDWATTLGLANVRPALALDAATGRWPIDHADAVVCINMVHISPWSATQGLMSGAGRVLPQGGLLYLYGPFREAEVPTAPSNEAFDADLKARNPAWGLRQKEKLVELAKANGLELVERIEMPANNLSLVFRKV